MKIKNKSNGVQANVPDTLGELLVKGGSWELDVPEAPAKPARKRAAKKTVQEPATEE